jgi:hypothetical protein
LGPQKKRPYLTDADPADAARCFHKGIQDAAMAIWR